MSAPLSLEVVIPVLNQHQATRRCLELLSGHASVPVRVLLVDNGSSRPAEHAVQADDLPLRLSVLRSPHNLGMVESLISALDHTTGEIIAYLHNDLFLHEPGWDRKVLAAFTADPGLAMAGLVAARGLAPDGGRIETYSHLLGLELGRCQCHRAAWQHHGRLMPPQGVAAAVLDGCGLFLRRASLHQVRPDRRYPLHHWYDREWSCAFLAAGWRLRGLDLRCDHGGGFTSCREADYHRSAERSARQRLGITSAPQGWDSALYQFGARLWSEKWSSRLPLFVDPDHTVHWAAAIMDSGRSRGEPCRTRTKRRT
jgi:glycosyltransferase involved in cell wall biosynthesis